jgi:hypothetical protein
MLNEQLRFDDTLCVVDEARQGWNRMERERRQPRAATSTAWIMGWGPVLKLQRSQRSLIVDKVFLIQFFAVF